MEENLVGYILESLDPETHRRVEAELRTNAQVRNRLDLLRRALEPLAADAADVPPPPDLWVRTLARIARDRCRPPGPPDGDVSGSPFRNLPRAPRPAWSEWLGSAGTLAWRRADVLVAALLLVVVGGLAVTWLGGAWRDEQVYACQNNLRMFHQALCSYSDQHDGEFPRVGSEPPRNVAGIFVPLLRDAGCLGGDVSVACPA